MKRKVSPEEYIGLLNRELWTHPGFREEMRFVPSPKGAKGHRITGFTMENIDEEVFADVSLVVFKHYQIGF